jgi:hypothetical protein
MSGFKKNLPVALYALASCASISCPAEAAYVNTIYQDGNDVVSEGVGSFDLTDLSYRYVILGHDLVNPSQAELQTGQPFSPAMRLWSGLTGPGSFGAGDISQVFFGSGDNVVLSGKSGTLGLIGNYVNGMALASSATWENASLATLGLTPGTYLWTWGTGQHADSFTLNIEAAPLAAPEPASWAMMLGGFGMIGAVLRKRGRSSVRFV